MRKDRLADGLNMLVMLPALDEERTIVDVIRRIPRDMAGISGVDVLVVDDGSTDATARLAEEAGAVVLGHLETRGVGAAFQTALVYGLEHGADVIVTIDSDGQFDPADIPDLIAPVLAGEADFTTASRFIHPDYLPNMPWIKKWGNRMMSRLVSSLAGQRLYDVSCGMRCYSRKAALHLHPLARFTYTQEVILNLAFKRLRIVEVPIQVRGVRRFGESRVANNLWRYAVRTARIVFSCYRDYHPLRVFGALSGVLGLVALALGGFFLQHYLTSGSFRPHTWAGVSSGALLGLAILIFHTGIIGDMLNRHRIYLEEILYRQRVLAGRDPAEPSPRTARSKGMEPPEPAVRGTDD